MVCTESYIRFLSGEILIDNITITSESNNFTLAFQ